MIARIWTAHIAPKNWPAYEQHFKGNVLPELRGVHGYVASQLLKREAGGEIAITVITVWQSWAAIDGFARHDREAAVVAPDAASLLTSYDRRVQHFEVAFADAAGSVQHATKT